VATLACKNIAGRYKQAYLGLAWAVLLPPSYLYFKRAEAHFADVI